MFIDGALFYNNPVAIADKESRLIWGSTLSSHPDIVLSLGTGFNSQQAERPPKRPSNRRGITRNILFLCRIASDHIQSALDCEKAWHEYVGRLPDDFTSSRFVRYNIDMINNLPALDDVDRLEALQQFTRSKLVEDADHIRKLAMQLIATSFYFETEKVQNSVQNAATITGK